MLLLPRGELPDAAVSESGLQIMPLTNTVPEEAAALMRRSYGLLPHVKVTDLLLEVDRWTDFSQHLTHVKTGEAAKDRILLLTAILADGINLGISKMAEACPGTTARKLDWLASLHIRDEAYTKALAELVNHHMPLNKAGEGETPEKPSWDQVQSAEFRAGSSKGARLLPEGSDRAPSGVAPAPQTPPQTPAAVGKSLLTVELQNHSSSTHQPGAKYEYGSATDAGSREHISLSIGSRAR